MKYGCPNNSCKFHQKKDHIIYAGTYFRKNDSRILQRYKCKYCGKKFSGATYSLAKNQKKRRINNTIKNMLASNMSMRRISVLLKVHRTTVKNKLIYLAKVARLDHKKFLQKISGMVTHLQFDDLITIEHTKLKPVTISVAVDVKTRSILSLKSGKIPAFGLLAELSRKKYGYRENEHPLTLRNMFDEIKSSINRNPLIETDEHQAYPPFVNKYFPNSEHIRHKGAIGCVAGQGELKKLHHDPLFTINHTCAMLRANISRLIRRSWCTTKSLSMLQDHLDLFKAFYNTKLLPSH